MSNDQFKPVLLTLPTSLTPSLAVEIIPYGLTFHRFIVQTDGKTHDIVVGPEAPENHVQQKYTSTVIGRYTNRVPVGTHKIERGGYTAEVKPEPNQNERVSLHGGPVGLDSLPWTKVTTPTLFSKKEVSHFGDSYSVFQFVSPDGQQGYPGALTIEALTALLPPADPSSGDLGSFIYVYRAKVDKGVTPVNLTNHWGFNLDASLNGADVLGHTLQIKADRIADRDADSLPTHKSLQVDDVPAHDHRKGKKISDLIPAAGYDDYYRFADRTINVPKRIAVSDLTDSYDGVAAIINKPATEPLVQLSSPASGLTVSFDTNQTGVMFYSNTGATADKGAKKKIHGGSGILDHGDSYTPNTAAMLEFHDLLSAFLNPDVKGTEDDTLFTQDEIYNNFVRTDVKYVAPK